jgi:hypothetical protein
MYLFIEIKCALIFLFTFLQFISNLLTRSTLIRDLQVFACSRTWISFKQRWSDCNSASSLVSTQLVDSLKMINISLTVLLCFWQVITFTRLSTTLRPRGTSMFVVKSEMELFLPRPKCSFPRSVADKINWRATISRAVHNLLLNCIMKLEPPPNSYSH